ncbi:hypothetical protein DAPPUDRAFT_337044 [Daphnia pulex]|uniref:Uncharacterized protein n=1 Tax=Daphnia pulex TaxID=6669 RepID=E9I0V3_DAPPU|nr:hypothetical protein DAPPUDRAFT_337044 [Daphnia pulex]|eukprot:EFX62376.1 hypothetical protein DAPPUDRAFT_337044 [Daphnia pulex]
MYKLLFQSGKVPAFIFHKNREIPGKTFNFGNSSNCAKSTTDTFCEVELQVSDIRYKNRHLEGYRETFQGPEAQTQYFNRSSETVYPPYKIGGGQ